MTEEPANGLVEPEHPEPEAPDPHMVEEREEDRIWGELQAMYQEQLGAFMKARQEENVSRQMIALEAMANLVTVSERRPHDIRALASWEV